LTILSSLISCQALLPSGHAEDGEDDLGPHNGALDHVARESTEAPRSFDHAEDDEVERLERVAVGFAQGPAAAPAGAQMPTHPGNAELVVLPGDLGPAIEKPAYWSSRAHLVSTHRRTPSSVPMKLKTATA
jgi:hypothetical protein